MILHYNSEASNSYDYTTRNQIMDGVLIDTLHEPF